MPITRDPDEFDTGLSPDVDVARPLVVETPWGTLALFRVDGELLCIQAFCPHLEGPLFQGSVSRGEVTCPWHMWRYDLRTGRRTDWRNPRSGPDARALRTSAVRIGPRHTLILTRPASAP